MKWAHFGASWVIMSEPVLKYTPACVPYGALAAALLSGLSLTVSEDSTLARDAPATLTLPSGYVTRMRSCVARTPRSASEGGSHALQRALSLRETLF